MRVFPLPSTGFYAEERKKRERERERGGELKAFLHAVLKAILEKYTDGINTPRLQFRPDKYWPAYGVFFLSLSLSLSLCLSLCFPVSFFFVINNIAECLTFWAAFYVYLCFHVGPARKYCRVVASLPIL